MWCGGLLLLDFFGFGLGGLGLDNSHLLGVVNVSDI